VEKPTENDWKSIIIPELQKYLVIFDSSLSLSFYIE
jgi:hypothetical protein